MEESFVVGKFRDTRVNHEIIRYMVYISPGKDIYYSTLRCLGTIFSFPPRGVTETFCCYNLPKFSHHLTKQKPELLMQLLFLALCTSTSINV